MDVQCILEMVAGGTVTPVIDQILTLEGAAEEPDRIEDHFRKLFISMEQTSES